MSDEWFESTLGPFYSLEAVADLRGVSSATLNADVLEHRLLVLTTKEGQQACPAWQFAEGGRLLAGLAPTLSLLLASTDAITAAIWLTTATRRLGGLSAIQWLQRGLEPNSVLVFAENDTVRWRT